MHQMSKAVQPQERFKIRWSNGFWKIYDAVTFKDLEMFDLRKDAEIALNGGNA